MKRGLLVSGLEIMYNIPVIISQAKDNKTVPTKYRGVNKMINREDMLELTRRMTLTRNSIDRIAGAYLDSEGFIDGTFNVNFLNLKASDREKNLAIAKAVLFSKTNVELTEQPVGKYHQLLDGIKTGFR